MKTLNISFIFKMLGIMFMIETLFLLLALGVSFLYPGDDTFAIGISCGILFGAGLLFFLIGLRTNEHAAGRREGMLVVTLTWALLSLFGMLPYYLSGYVDNVTDAYFETMSGFTTTGASILTDIEALPKGLLFWRSLTQWQGGMGMIVFTVALLPILGEGASQMFDAESTGITHERFRPRITQVAKRLWGVYLFLTALLAFLLCIGPMDLYDAVNHAMTTLGTGGYSTKNASIAYWHSPYVEYLLALFMCVGSTNMTLIYFLFNGRFNKLWKEEETRWYYAVIGVATLLTTSLISTSGFMTKDYITWGPFFWVVALLLMFVCGCAGSTSGGFKTGRFVILVKNLLNVFKKQTHPHAIIPVRFNGHDISEDNVNRVMAFAFAYVSLMLCGCLILTFDGVGFEEAIGASVSAVSNVGPGLGACGPVYNYSGFSDLSKWVLTFLMMTGRLEVFTVLTILLPGFWKQ